jgi:hypothetical protein
MKMSILGGIEQWLCNKNFILFLCTCISDDSDEDISEEERPPIDLDLPDEKIGAKKLKKLQEKAEKRATREVYALDNDSKD